MGTPRLHAHHRSGVNVEFARSREPVWRNTLARYRPADDTARHFARRGRPSPKLRSHQTPKRRRNEWPAAPLRTPGSRPLGLEEPPGDRRQERQLQLRRPEADPEGQPRDVEFDAICQAELNPEVRGLELEP